MRSHRRVWLGVAVATVAASVLTACAPPLPLGDGVVVITTDVSPALATALEESFTAWSQTSGIKVSVDVVDEVDAASAGDIGLWSSVSALMASHSEENPRDIAQLTKGEGEPWTERLLPGLKAPVTTEEDVVVLGVPFSIGVDTLVYANPQAFTEHGYTIPTTGAQTEALAESVTADETGFPWCAGVEAGADSGREFANWLDYAILNISGPEAYGQWRRGELAPDAPAVARAVTSLEETLLNDSAVKGGRNGVALNGFANTAPLFEKAWRKNGQCLLYIGGSEITTTFPEAVVTEVIAGDDSRLAVLPFMMGADDEFSLIATASYFSAIALDEDVVAVLEYAASPEFAKKMTPTPGYLSPWKSSDAVVYADPVTTSIGSILQRATTIELNRFAYLTDAEQQEFLAVVMAYLSGDANWSGALAE
jgi:alpha-glucoside transport system substrate-binding protein